VPIATLNPATGELVESYTPYTGDQVERILEAAHVAQQAWAHVDVNERAARLAPLAGLLRERVDEYATLMTIEMGKPVSQARAEVLKCALCVDHYVENGVGYLAPLDIPVGVTASGVRHLPLGVVLGVMPWNYPFWQVLRFAIPTILAGNGVVLKHASNVPGSALALETLARDAGLPAGLFGTVLVEGGDVLPILRDDRIAAVSLTGSEGVGRRIGSEAGAALKPAVLELGGSDPFIVLDDANIGAAATAAVTARMQNNGQSCIAAKRFIVQESVHDEFVDAFTEALKVMQLGDPLDPETQLGPMAREDLRDELHEQVAQTVSGGGTAVVGGNVPNQTGAFYPASLIVGVGPGMTGFDEELFGPAGVVASATDDADAIRLANWSRYGLGSSVWSADTDRALALGAELQSGMVFVNEFVKSDPRLPFGGVKASGYGRELGPQGSLEFVNKQTTWVA
jgi:succinate-semialdehyde dehydrogenase/glutarate-semialdehyde dehydrogenase